MTEHELCKIACESMKNSYAPYSLYNVGAALLCKDGSVYTGCNIENAAYSPSVCAERTAFYKAVSEGKRSFSMIAVAGGKNGMIKGAFPPCGVCRQVMAEFCSEDFIILLVEDENNFKRFSLSELLPGAFSPDNIFDKQVEL